MIFVILIIALVLRLITLNQSLWLDEAIGALVFRDLSLRELFTNFFTIDNHPPLYYLLLKIWTACFGYSEISLRIPSVLFGIATIYISYLIWIKITNNKQIGLIVALFLATSQFHIYYSQEARMYSMAAFFASVAIYCYLQILNSMKGVWYWVLFSLSITIMVFSDYMPVFLIPVFVVYGLFKKMDKNWWRKMFLTFIPLLLFGIFWLPLFTKQLEGGKWLMETLPKWRTIAGGANLKQFLLVWMKFSLGRISFENKFLYYVVSTIASIPFMILIIYSLKVLRKHLIIFLWLFMPLIISLTASIFFPAFIYFRFMYLIPAFYLILGLGLNVLGNKRRLFWLLSGIVLLVNITASLYYYSDPFQKREQWKEAVYFIENRIKNNEIVLFSYPEPFAGYRWYENKQDISFGATNSISAGKNVTYEKTKDLLKIKTGIYYFEYLKDISDPEMAVLSSIYSEGFHEREKFGRFNGIGYIYYFQK